MKKEIFFISNIVSLSRFLLLAVTLYFFFTGSFLLVLIFIFLIWVSDLLDGYLARSRNEISELGKIIDPIADKVCVILIVFSLLIKDIIPLWYVIITVLRDVFILSGGLYLKYRKNTVLQSNWAGKVAVFTIGLTLFIAIFNTAAKSGSLGNYFLYHTEFLELLYYIAQFISLVMIFISLISYFNRFLTISKKLP